MTADSLSVTSGARAVFWEAGAVVLVGEARAVAAQWVAAHAPGCGAFLTGSSTVLPLDVLLPAASDVDVVVVVVDGPAPPKLGKLLWRGVLLDVSYVSTRDIANPDAVSFHLAPNFASGQFLADPTGHLGRLRDAIAPGFASSEAVRARCASVAATISRRLAALDPAAPWPSLVTAWLFPTSLTAVVPMVAALRTPTVRLRYLAARELLPPSMYERLLELLGCATVDRDVVAGHLDRLADVFDRTAAVAPSAEIGPAARPVAIGGSRELVERGDHREAVFWIVATWARCEAAESPGFQAMTADLTGLAGPATLLDRRDTVVAFLPSLLEEVR